MPDGEACPKPGTRTIESEAQRLAEEYEKSSSLIRELRQQMADANKSLATCNALLPAVTDPSIAWAAISMDTHSSSLSSSSDLTLGMVEDEEMVRKLQETMKRSTDLCDQLRNGTATRGSVETLLEEVSELLERCESPTGDEKAS